MLHICLVTFISFISYTKVHLIYFVYQSAPHLFYWSYSISFTFTRSGYTLPRLHSTSLSLSLFNQSCFWKLRVPLNKVSIWNTYCITWSWNPLVSLIFVTLLDSSASININTDAIFWIKGCLKNLLSQKWVTKRRQVKSHSYMNYPRR